MPRKWILCAACVLSAAVTGCQTSGTAVTANSPLGDLLKKKDATTESKASGVSPEYKVASSQLSDPESVLLAYAMWKEQSSQYAEARSKYQDIVNSNPSNLQATLGLARTEYRSGRRTQAIEILTRASKTFPNNPDVFREQAAFHAHMKDWDQAITAYEKAVQLNPTHSDGRYRLGTALAQAGRIDEAMPHLTFSVGDAAAYYNVGFILFQQDRAVEARPYFERALQESPSPEAQARASQMLARINPPVTRPANTYNGMLAQGNPATVNLSSGVSTTYPSPAQQVPIAQNVTARQNSTDPVGNARLWTSNRGMQPNVTAANFSGPTISAAGAHPMIQQSGHSVPATPAVVPPLPSSFDRAVSSAMGFSAQSAPRAAYTGQPQTTTGNSAGIVVPSHWNR